MQAPGAARGNAAEPMSEDSELLRSAMPQTAALEALFSCSTPETICLLAGRPRGSLDLNQWHCRWSDKTLILLKGTRIEQIVVLQR